jgi:hypothetical protein
LFPQIPPEEIRRNIEIFQLLGARRAKLSRNRCGYVHHGTVFICFDGHERFDDPGQWAGHYPGPLYSRNLEDINLAEEQLEAVGLHQRFASALVRLVEPRWEQLTSGEEVLEFWFKLTHASAATRFKALWNIRGELRQVSYESELQPHDYDASDRDFDVLSHAIELAPPENASAEARENASVRFRQFVRELTPHEANILLASMYLARGDFPNIHVANEELARNYESNDVIATQLLNKGPLERHLREAYRVLKRQR